MKIRWSAQLGLLLREFLRDPHAWQYGYELSRITGLKSGTLYPLLARLAELQMLETRWEHVENGRPPRHMYKLSVDGLKFARERVQSSQAPARIAQELGKVGVR
jgi:DNA-binding PadR family transcriptional regulator